MASVFLRPRAYSIIHSKKILSSYQDCIIAIRSAFDQLSIYGGASVSNVVMCGEWVGE
jgi:hypothetical protein